MNQRQDGPGLYHHNPGIGLLANRAEAGARLAERLSEYRGHNALVLALPRGGVPVAAEIARHLRADLDVLAVRKLGAPGQPELAIGAVTADGTRYLNQELTGLLGISHAYIEEVTERESEDAQQRERRLRAGLPPLAIDGRTVIVVDDGLATGATMRAAIWSLRRGQPRKIVVAVPVGGVESCASIDAEVDELVSLHQANPFYAVEMYYRDFDQVSDGDVAKILLEHRKPLTRGAVLGSHARR